MKGILINSSDLKVVKPFLKDVVDKRSESIKISDDYYTIWIGKKKFFFWTLDLKKMLLVSYKLKKIENKHIGVMFCIHKHMVPVLGDVFFKNVVVESITVVLGQIYVPIFFIVRFFFMKILTVLSNLKNISKLKNE